MSKVVTVGPGTLIFHSDGLISSKTDYAARVTKASVTASAKREDPIQFLDGSTEAGESKYTAELAFTIAQDIFENNGFVAGTWKNAGKTINFEYVPNDKGKIGLKGRAIVDPITLGGDVGSAAMSDVTWTCPELPTVYTPETKTD